MALELMEISKYVVYLLIDIFALLATLFAVLVLVKIWKKGHKKSRTRRMLVVVFSFLALGMASCTIAEISWDVLEFIFGMSPELGVPDYFWIVCTSFLFIGFTYFSISMFREHGEIKKGVIVISISAVICAGILYWLIGSYILGFQQGESAFEMFIDYFYPIMSALIVISTLSVYIFFKRFPTLGIPLLLLAIGSMMSFGGDMLYTYYSWNELDGILELVSDSLYTFDYAISAAAFYMLLKKWAGVEFHED